MAPDLKLISMDEIKAEEVKWLWYPYLPRGKLTIVQGDPGEGKTTFVLAVIAALLSGPKNFRALQDLTGATPGNLGKQLEVLEAEGYLRSEKAFVGRRPNTTYTLLPYGREQFAQYVALLESLLAGAQGEEGADSPS